MKSAGAILVAAGSGSRAGGFKQFEVVGGRPTFLWSLEALKGCPTIEAIVVVVPSGRERQAAQLAANPTYGTVQFIAGGERRQDSVRLGLDALPDCEWVVVHDAARPLVTSELIDEALTAAKVTGAASIGTPLADALKRVTEENLVQETVSRAGLWAVQTPQAFRTELLRRAHEEVSEDVPDDAAMIEKIGGRVALFEGPRSNIKITSADDFALVEALMRSSTSA